MIFNALATKVLINADRFFINHYVDAREVGLYELANKFAAVLPILITNPFSLIWPAMRFQVMKDEDADEYYSLVLTYLSFLSLISGSASRCSSRTPFASRFERSTGERPRSSPSSCCTTSSSRRARASTWD